MDDVEPRSRALHQRHHPPLCEDDLPPEGTRRWVARRKACVVAAIRQGLLSADQACDRYALTGEELASWERLVERHGVRGLKVTHLKEFRGAAALS